MAGRLDSEIDLELETGLITGHAGVPGLIEAVCQTGTVTVIDRELKPPAWAERVGDGRKLVGDVGGGWRAVRRSRSVPPGTGRWRCGWGTSCRRRRPRATPVQFHAEDLPAPQKDKAPVTVETAPPGGLASATVELVVDLQCRRPVRTAMPDVEATVIHCDRHAAKRTYDGDRGSRPALAR